jgi:hypothetical protein
MTEQEIKSLAKQIKLNNLLTRKREYELAKRNAKKENQ